MGFIKATALAIEKKDDHTYLIIGHHTIHGDIKYASVKKDIDIMYANGRKVTPKGTWHMCMYHRTLYVFDDSYLEKED